jgi:Tol biopolymer transport system component
LRGGLVALLVALVVPAAASADYSGAPFTVSTSKVSFGQAPVFMPDGRHVVYGQDYKQGDRNQVYEWNTAGAGQPQCLTCSGPGSGTDNVNGVPAVRPQGDWILFHSWRGHYTTIGSPGYGGLGSALWAMRPDGSGQTQLTEVQPPGAAPFSGEG